jgi:hypothetical protein
MKDEVTLRPRFGRVLAILVGVIVLVALVSFVFERNWLGLARGIAPLLLVGYLVWVLFWEPGVTINPAGVTLVNLVRSHRISWPAIMRIDTKYALTLYTPTGKFVAWAAPAPGLFAATHAAGADLKGLPESTYSAGNRVGPGDLPTSESGVAGYHVRRQWEQYRDAGLLDTIEGTGVETTWHVRTIIVLGVLVVASILALLL